MSTEIEMSDVSRSTSVATWSDARRQSSSSSGSGSSSASSAGSADALPVHSSNGSVGPTEIVQVSRRAKTVFAAGLLVLLLLVTIIGVTLKHHPPAPAQTPQVLVYDAQAPVLQTVYVSPVTNETSNVFVGQPKVRWPNAVRRQGHAASVFVPQTRQLFVIGGQLDDGNATDAVWIYTEGSNSWTQGPSLNVPRMHASAVLYPEGQIQVCGCFAYSTGDPAEWNKPECARSCEWLTLTNMTAGWSLEAIEPQQNYFYWIIISGHSAVYYKDRMVVMGGIWPYCGRVNLTSPTLNCLEERQLAFDGALSYDRHQPDDPAYRWGQIGSMNVRRMLHSSATDNKYIYACGGYGGSGPIGQGMYVFDTELSSCERAQPFETKNNGWKVVFKMTDNRQYFGMVMLPLLQQLVIAGGNDNSSSALATVEVCYLDGSVITRTQCVEAGQLDLPTNMLSAVAIGSS